MNTMPWKGKSKQLKGKKEKDEKKEKDDSLPATYISWEDATLFCEKLSKMDGQVYRLPVESEWEYACRAGTKTSFYFWKSYPHQKKSSSLFLINTFGTILDSWTCMEESMNGVEILLVKITTSNLKKKTLFIPKDHVGFPSTKLFVVAIPVVLHAIGVQRVEIFQNRPLVSL